MAQASKAQPLAWQCEVALPYALLQFLPATPHPPQLVWLLERLISQPSIGMPLQSANGDVQLLTWHMPVVHLGEPLATVHPFPHPPQWLRSVSVLVSHPSA